jgi:hypothetical protein
MKRGVQSLLWGSLAAAVIVGALWQFYRLPDAQARFEAFPLDGPGFRGEELFLSPFEEKFFKGVNVLKRLYNVDGNVLFVTALDGSGNRHVVHDPYYCFRGAGWEVLEGREVTVPAGNAELIVIKREGEIKEALVWFSDSRDRYTSPVTYWWQTTLRRLTLGFSGPEPVLVMIQPMSRKDIEVPLLVVEFPQLFEF